MVEGYVLVCTSAKYSETRGTEHILRLKKNSSVIRRSRIFFTTEEKWPAQLAKASKALGVTVEEVIEATGASKC